MCIGVQVHAELMWEWIPGSPLRLDWRGHQPGGDFGPKSEYVTGVLTLLPRPFHIQCGANHSCSTASPAEIEANCPDWNVYSGLNLRDGSKASCGQVLGIYPTICSFQNAVGDRVRSRCRCMCGDSACAKTCNKCTQCEKKVVKVKVQVNRYCERTQTPVCRMFCLIRVKVRIRIKGMTAIEL